MYTLQSGVVKSRSFDIVGAPQQRYVMLTIGFGAALTISDYRSSRRLARSIRTRVDKKRGSGEAISIAVIRIDYGCSAD